MDKTLQEFYRRRSERLKSHEDANNKLPYGLCKEHGITLKEGATPHEAWEELKKLGITPPWGEGEAPEGNQEASQEKAKSVSQKTGVNYTTPSSEGFQKTFLEARDTIDLKDKWRVDAGYELKDYDTMDRYVTEGGSTFAIHDGDIVSVCAKKGDEVRGGDLMKAALAAGGNKLDAYDGISGFYLACGFEPVAWTPFNPEINGDWKEAHKTAGAKPEDVIFYKYTGNIVPKAERETYIEEFKKRVAPCLDKKDANGEIIESGYEKAYAMRDENMKGGKQ